MLKIIIIIVLIIILGYLLFFHKKEQMTNCQSDCNMIDDDCIIEDCLKKSKGKPMDDFRKCLTSNGISETLAENFSTLKYAMLLNKVNDNNFDTEFCNTLKTAIDTAKE
jgi:hypothetical protein